MLKKYFYVVFNISIRPIPFKIGTAITLNPPGSKPLRIFQYCYFSWNSMRQLCYFLFWWLMISWYLGNPLIVSEQNAISHNISKYSIWFTFFSNLPLRPNKFPGTFIFINSCASYTYLLVTCIKTTLYYCWGFFSS